MRFAFVAFGAALILLGCSPTMTHVRTINPEEYAKYSWIGHTGEDVVLAWGENGQAEPDGSGGRVLTYHRLQTSSSEMGWPPVTVAPGPGPVPATDKPNVPNVVVTTDLAKFWIGSDGKVYRYWFDNEVFKKHLDAPGARPVEYYGNRTSH